MKVDPRRIRRLRELAGMAQADLATKAQISRSYLSEIEAGRYEPSPRVAARIAAALNVAIVDLTP